MKVDNLIEKMLNCRYFKHVLIEKANESQYFGRESTRLCIF